MDVEYLKAQTQVPNFLREELHVVLPRNAQVGHDAGVSASKSSAAEDPEDVVQVHFFSTQLHALIRSGSEPMAKCLKRVEIALRKGFGKSKRSPSKGASKGSALDADGFSVLYDSQLINAEELANRSGWQDGMLVRMLGLGGGGSSSGDDANLDLTVRLSPPEVLTLTTLPAKAPLAGFPLTPKATIRNGGAVETLWYMQSPCPCPCPTGDAGVEDWALVSDAPVFVPPLSSVGSKIKVFATPIDRRTGRRGRTVVFYVGGVVTAMEATPQEQITHVRKAFITLPRSANIDTAAHGAPIANTGADTDSQLVTLEEIGMHFTPLFGDGGPRQHPTYLNSSASRCSAAVSVSNASDYHMDFVQLQRNPLDYVHADLTISRGPRDFRVVCYNILADPFATSEFAKTQLFPYCDKQHLLSDYRSQLVVGELAAYDADIILLQECDARVARTNLQLLNILNSSSCSNSSDSSTNRSSSGSDSCREGVQYALHYTGKDTTVPEGCCTIVNTDVFVVAATLDVHLGRAIQVYLEQGAGISAADPSETASDEPEVRAAHAALLTFLLAHDEAWQVLTQRLGMIGQISVLRHKAAGGAGHYVCVANTHLFYHPAASYARLLQTHILCLCLHTVAQYIRRVGSVTDFKFPGTDVHSTAHADTAYTAGHGGEKPKVSVILAGDLNSTLETPTLEYLTTGGVSASHSVWDSLGNFKWSRKRGGGGDDEQGGEEGETAGDGGAGRAAEPPAGFKLASAMGRLAMASAVKPTLHNPFRKKSSSEDGASNNLSSLRSASGYPQFTNYTAFFKDVLDYIFVGADSTGGLHPLQVLRTAPFPSEAQLGARVALPSLAHPSDHVAIAVDLSLG